MLSKKNLWFITLFSIILVMAVYYVSVPSVGETLFVNTKDTSANDVTIDVSETSNIVAMRVSRDEELEKEVDAIKEILTSSEKSSEEKNDAYDALKSLNSNKGKEESIESIIKKNFNHDCFVKIDGANVKVIVDTLEHSYDLANKIISTVQNEFKDKVYVTISFGTK